MHGHMRAGADKTLSENAMVSFTTILTLQAQLNARLQRAGLARIGTLGVYNFEPETLQRQRATLSVDEATSAAHGERIGEAVPSEGGAKAPAALSSEKRKAPDAGRRCGAAHERLQAAPPPSPLEEGRDPPPAASANCSEGCGLVRLLTLPSPLAEEATKSTIALLVANFARSFLIEMGNC
eukprot:GHVT01000483.1.p1 GENE.GHVT01000483.1~~GHVT01000483.1.p1  ORF type:complete len:181 (+),score=33.52 GHVT01000483.1:1359-1901(+)